MSSSDRRSHHRQRDYHGSTHEKVKINERGADNDRESGRNKEREWRCETERDREREKESYKDRGRDYHRDRNKGDKERGRFSEQGQNHGYDDVRSQDYGRDRSRRNRHRSRSRSKERYRKRSKSRSTSPSKSKRTSGFDMAPSAAVLPVATITGQFHGAQPLTGMFSSILPLLPPQVGSLPIMQTPAVAQQATRHARRVYVGGLPPLANEQTIAAFFSNVMHAIGGNSVGQGDAVVNVYINHEKKFAFVEMRSVEEASNAMALDGIIFEGVAVRVRRPTDYNPSLAAPLGPSQPSPFLDLAAVGLSPGATGGAEGPDRIFVGGLPYYFSDAQIRELLESFGPLRGFNLVKDRDTGNSKGYGFCVYQDPSVTDVACAALNGLKMGDKTLTIRRASTSFEQMKPEQELILQQAQHHIAMQKLALQAGGGSPLSGVGLMVNGLSSRPTKILCLTEVVSVDELKDDDEYQEILDDMRQESGKFGALINVIIPRPSLTGEVTPGVGKVFLEFADTNASERARTSLNGRKFGENVAVAEYYPEDKFNAGDYGVIPVI